MEAGKPYPSLQGSPLVEKHPKPRGRLRVFFGMYSGVGKTYAMLQAVRQIAATGVEVVVGSLDTRGRRDIEGLLAGLAVVPSRLIVHQKQAMPEMDLDALLLWHPSLVIVDDLAHSNTQGSRHPKRYQDVWELLEAGIDVFTTLNVLNLESRADLVSEMMGVSISERVPDSILDAADEITLIDLTPAGLLLRLFNEPSEVGKTREGEVSEANLSALREMALRVVAEHVDRNLRESSNSGRGLGAQRSAERLLVAVGEGPFSEKLLRYTRRLAATMKASWVAVNIETPGHSTRCEMTQLTRNLSLARKLGADVISTSGVDVSTALLRVAREEHVTQIVLGKPLQNWWSRWFGKPSPVDKLIRESGPIGIHLIHPQAMPRVRTKLAVSAGSANWDWKDPLRATGIVVGVTLFGLLIHDFAGYWSVALVYLLAIVVASTRLERRSALLLALVSAVLWDVLFIPPRFAFSIAQFSDVVMFVVFLVVTQIVVQITGRLREREHAERLGEERASALYRVTRELAGASDRAAAIERVMLEVERRFNAQATVLLNVKGELCTAGAANFCLTPKEEEVAAWAFQHRQPAGRFTDTLEDAEAFHLPLLSGQQTEGVLVVRTDQGLSFAQQELLQAIAAQLAVYLEKERALLGAQSAKVAEQSDRLRKTLLDSVSHELKTPLAVLSGALEQVDLNRGEMQAAVRRLTRTVNLLLKSTRLEEGQLQLQKEWCEPDEIAREAVQITELEGRSVSYDFGGNLPSLLCDVPLLAQALSFMIANAAQHSDPHGLVEIRGIGEIGAVTFEVLDRGRGFLEGEEHRIFDKFYRGAFNSPGGLGLGLSITRQLVEAHGGGFGARNREGGGAIVWIRIPVDDRLNLPDL